MPAPSSLIIRDAQLKALGKPRLDNFIARLRDHVAEVFPAQAATVQGSHGATLLEALVERARGYELPDERNITLFVDLCFGIGFDFDESPEYESIRKRLRSTGISPSARMHLIYDELRARSAQTAAGG